MAEPGGEVVLVSPWMDDVTLYLPTYWSSYTRHHFLESNDGRFGQCLWNSFHRSDS